MSTGHKELRDTFNLVGALLVAPAAIAGCIAVATPSLAFGLAASIIGLASIYFQYRSIEAEREHALERHTALRIEPPSNSSNVSLHDQLFSQKFTWHPVTGKKHFYK